MTERQQIDSAAQQIHRFAEQQQISQIILVADPVTWEESGVPECLEAHLSTALYVPIKGVDIDDSLRPMVFTIPLHTTAERLLHDSVAAAHAEATAATHDGRKPRSVCAWAVTSTAADVFAQSFSQLCRAQIAGTTRTLRMWDPRLMNSWDALSGRSDVPSESVRCRWFYLDWHGRLQYRDIGPTSDTTIRWDAAKIDSLGWHNRLAQMHATHWELSTDVSHSVWQALETPVIWGIAEASDRFGLAKAILTHGRALEHAKGFQALLEALKRHPGAFSALTDEMEGADWENWVREGTAALHQHNTQKA
jgi:hypothetical protein